MKFILGTKKEMTQIFDEKGTVRAGTIVAAGPVTVTALKTKEKDGYTAVQIGFDTAKEKNVSKSVRGHLKASSGLFKNIKEYRTEDAPAVGTATDVTVFAEGDVVTVSGISKGKGFQGVVKRHGFSGGPRTHGQKHSEHEPGSIGGGLRTRVPKGKRMAGRMGTDRVSVKNLRILKVIPESNEIIISGAIPGRRGTLLEITGQ